MPQLNPPEQLDVFFLITSKNPFCLTASYCVFLSTTVVWTGEGGTSNSFRSRRLFWDLHEWLLLQDHLLTCYPAFRAPCCVSSSAHYHYACIIWWADGCVQSPANFFIFYFFPSNGFRLPRWLCVTNHLLRLVGHCQQRDGSSLICDTGLLCAQSL